MVVARGRRETEVGSAGGGCWCWLHSGVNTHNATELSLEMVNWIVSVFYHN